MRSTATVPNMNGMQNVTIRSWRMEHLDVGFNANAIVSDISCSIALGDLVAITGANGVGKSCLLKTLAGELPPVAGRVLAPAGFAHDGLGVVPQLTDLEPRFPISLREMIALGASGIRDPFLKEHVDEALIAVGFNKKHAQQSWQRSSGGERQRALIARAFIRRPEILLLDEATNNLDVASTHLIFEKLHAKCAAKKLAIIAVLHDANLVSRYFNKNIHIADGHAKLSGWPS